MLLTIITLLPLVFAGLLFLMPSVTQVRYGALLFSLIQLLIGFILLTQFDSSTAHLQFVEQYAWMPMFGIQYFLGIDGISLWLVILTLVLQPLVILGSWTAITERVKGFHSALFVLQTAMLGTFLSLDAVLFYLFWELSLVPMYFLIGLWGGSRRIYATVKFFIYTMAGSILMLVAMIYLMLLHKEVTGIYSANLLDWYQLTIPFIGGEFFTPQTLLFFAFALAFAIKTPAFPVHTWLPDAHVEAPTAGSVILAGVMLKMGTYGFLRWVIPLFPQASQYWAWLFMAIGVMGIIYGAMMALIQTDMKKLVAYSSVSHMGYVLLGLFAFNEFGLTGSLYQMLNHGVSTGALFLLVGMIYERTHTREIAHYGGLASILPWYTIIFVIVTMSSIAVPMTNGFVGEFLILLGAFKAYPVWSYFAVLGVVLGAAYMLWMVKKVFFGHPGQVTQDEQHPLKDLSLREWIILTPLVILIFWMGLMPNHFLSFSKESLNYLNSNVSSYELKIEN
jgi:NADH-quinone oxidoreductase subunit M